MLQSSYVETVVGIFVTIGLASLLMLSMKVSNLSSMTREDGYVLKVQFQNIGGLKVRSPVKMSGVVVGRVGRIYIDNESYYAIVELSIYEDFNFIPTDTSADIYTAGLLGEQYISLSPGAQETYLKNGDMIKFASDAVVLEQIIGRIMYNKAAE